MEIKSDVIKKLIEVWNNKRDSIIEGNIKGFTNYSTKGGGKVCTTKIKNSQGWYAIVCFYECSAVVEVYDMHQVHAADEQYAFQIDSLGPYRYPYDRRP